MSEKYASIAADCTAQIVLFFSLWRETTRKRMQIVSIRNNVTRATKLLVRVAVRVCRHFESKLKAETLLCYRAPSSIRFKCRLGERYTECAICSSFAFAVLPVNNLIKNSKNRAHSSIIYLMRKGIYGTTHWDDRDVWWRRIGSERARKLNVNIRFRMLNILATEKKHIKWN